MGDLRRGLLPARRRLQRDQQPARSASRTARRAYSRARTTRCARSRPARRASRTPMRRSRRSTRSVTTASSRSGRPSGRRASTRGCSATGFSSTSRTTRKLTQDALISAIIAPSLGSGATSQRANLGSVKNAGLEVTLGGQIIDRRAARPRLPLRHVAQREQGRQPRHARRRRSASRTGSSPAIRSAASGRKPITGWNDKNDDGILTVDEVNDRSRIRCSARIDPVDGQTERSSAQASSAATPSRAT